jgi:hypothetical protein
MQQLQGGNATTKAGSRGANNSSHVEDKENNKREANANRQPTVIPSSGQQTASITQVLKRSKTTDPSRAPLRQKESVQ